MHRDPLGFFGLANLRERPVRRQWRFLNR